MDLATLFFSIVTILLSTSLIKAQKNIEKEDPLLLWRDEFNDTKINTSVWTARLGNNNGWGNGELQYIPKKTLRWKVSNT